VSLATWPAGPEEKDRSHAEAGDSEDLPSDWEALTGSEGNVIGVICPGCRTPEEAQALDEQGSEP
jgi:hypothetical protein